MKRFGMLAALGAWLGGILAGCPQPLSSTFGDSVRMMTFNVQFLPGSDDDETRSVRIAKRVLDADYDIVVLNEVFDEEAREVFAGMLRFRYPSYVAYIGDAAVGAEDSGLMLFSKFPFQPLPNPAHRHDPGYLTARNAGADWKDVAFIEYDEDVFPDNWAGKGAAFVRIMNPYTDRIYNVAFTHMQASYPEDEDNGLQWMEPITARAAQLDDIRKVITESLLPGQLDREDTFVLGDLNIDGDLDDANLTAIGFDRPNLYEWVERFGTTGTFFTDKFHDTWAYEQPTEDRGLTNLYHWGPDYSPDQGARLDYILKDQLPGPVANGKLVIQHLTQAHNMRDGAPFIESGIGFAGINELSDHIGLNADINRWAPHCRPLEAALPMMDIELSGTITYQGSMQWYRVDQPGTYAFAITGTGMEYRVYEPNDMSTPVSEYFGGTTNFFDLEGKPHVGNEYVLPEAPFYVRVFNSDRTRTGNFTFTAHRNLFTSQSEAGVLLANEPLDFTLPGTPINTTDTAWFELHTETLDSGEPHSLRFIVDNFDTQAFQLQVRRADGVSVVDTESVATEDPDNPGKLRIVIQHTDLALSGQKLYMLVTRTDLSATRYRVGWKTNISVMHGVLAGIPGSASENLYCVEETDTAGIDELYLTVIVDDITKVDDVYIGDYDNGSYRTLEDLVGTIRYLDYVHIILRDEDGGLNGEDDYLEGTIRFLRFDRTHSLNVTKVLECCGGKYLFRYNLSRSLQR